MLLFARSGFDVGLIARITSSTPKAVEDGYNSAALKIAAMTNSGEPGFLKSIVSFIPTYSISPTFSHNTVALSQLMGDIDDTKHSVFTLRNMVLVGLALLGIAWVVWRRFIT